MEIFNTNSRRYFSLSLSDAMAWAAGSKKEIVYGVVQGGRLRLALLLFGRDPFCDLKTLALDYRYLSLVVERHNLFQLSSD